MLRLFDFPSSRCLAVVLGLAALLFVPALFGQTLASTASVSGIVADPQGARISGATVTILSTEQSFTRTFTTDASGRYSFTLLPPAAYILKVEAAGFAKFEQHKIVLEVGQAAVLDVGLTIGTASAEVVVSAQAPLLNTENANVGSEITAKQIVELPLNLRNPVALTFLDSSVKFIDEGYEGAGPDTADQDISFMTFNGQFMGSTAFLLDGAWDAALGWGGVIYVPTVDSVQEFKVQTNSFTAQYGLSTGNVVNIVSKSGTSQFHGDAYEFFRNSALDGNYYFNSFNNAPKTLLQMNQFGASEGGPLYIPGISTRKDRTFFFVLYEGLRLSSPTSTTYTMPTGTEKTGDLSALLGAQIGTDALCRPVLAGQVYNPSTTRQVSATCAVPATGTFPGITVGQTVFIRDPIAGNNLSGLINPVSGNLLPFFPSPTNTSLGNNFFKAVAVPVTSNEFSVRIDHNITDNARIYARYSHKTESKVGNPDYYGASDPGGPGQINPNNRWSVGAGYSQVLSPTLTASLNFGFSRWIEGNESQGYPFNPATLGLPAFLTQQNPIFPHIDLTGYASLGNAYQMGSSNQAGTISADITKVHGSHTLSFGYAGIMTQLYGGYVSFGEFDFTPSFTSALAVAPSVASATGNSFASLLLGDPGSGYTYNLIRPGNTKISHGWYLQDAWKATRKLTLNVGARYDLQPGPTELYNRQVYFNPTAVNPITALVGNGTTYHGALVYNSSSNPNYFKTNYFDVSPRVGFAYQVMKNLVARGGFGIFYPNNFLGSTSNTGYTQLTFVPTALNGGLTPATTLSNPFPTGPIPLTGSSLGGLTSDGQGVSTAFQNPRSPYMQQWSFGLQYSPTPNDVLEATYIGNHGVHLVVGNGVNMNQLNPSYLTSMSSAQLNAPVTNPFFGQAAMAGSPCGLANATVPAFQLLLPMPQYCDEVTNALSTQATSSYNGLQLRYTHRTSHGLQVLANYTHSKWLDDAYAGPAFTETLYTSASARNNYNLGAEKSVDQYNTPNSAVISFIYELPFGRGRSFGSHFSRAKDAVLGGWQIASINSFKDGTPVGIRGNFNPGSLYGGNQHIEEVGNPNQPGNMGGQTGCPTTLHTVKAWFNPCAFQAAAAGTFGNTPNYLPNVSTPGYVDTDFSVSKWFNFTESFRMQFRSEFFNVFNHPPFGAPWGNYSPVGTGNFGTITYADISRQIQFAAKFYW